jgi:hypothetical protein
VLALLAPPIFLFLIANLLYPKQVGEVDLEEYDYRQSPILWGLVVAGTLSGTFLQPIVFGDPVLHPSNISGIPMLFMCGVLAMSKNRRVHSVLGPVIILMVLLDTILVNPAISAG